MKLRLAPSYLLLFVVRDGVDPSTSGFQTVTRRGLTLL
jgi:hypothetical protein